MNITIKKADFGSSTYTSPMLSEYKIRQILSHISSTLGYSIASDLHIPGDYNEQKFSSYGLDYKLDLGGWSLKKSGFLGRIISKTFDDLPQLHYSIECEPGWELKGHLIVGKQNVKREAIRSGQEDDRVYYDAALNFARLYFAKEMPQKVLGVHIFFLEGYSHVAFTTKLHGMATLLTGGAGTYSRIYSVALPHPRKEYDLEFAFFFFFNGSPYVFYKHAHLMDRLVLSLRLL